MAIIYTLFKLESSQLGVALYDGISELALASVADTTRARAR
jgi:hypothetical protein